MKSLPYESATSGDKALTEIQSILGQFGCGTFGTMIDATRGVTIVQFLWKTHPVSIEASWKGYAAAWLKRHPYTHRMRCSRDQHERHALDQAKISVCSILRDWVKAQITAYECGLLPFEGVFMPYLMLPDGRRLLDRVQSEILALPSPQ